MILLTLLKNDLNAKFVEATKTRHLAL